MLSDESSSDSETGRFKCRTKPENEQSKSSHKRSDNIRSTERNRPSENDKFRREFDRKRNERDRFDRRSRDRFKHSNDRYSRHSPVKRRYSRERSPSKRSRDRSPNRKPRQASPTRSRPRSPIRKSKDRHTRNSASRDKSRPIRSISQDRQRRSRSHKTPEKQINIKEDAKRNLKDQIKETIDTQKKEYHTRKSEEKSSSPEYRGKRSEVHKPPSRPDKKKSESPIIVEEHAATDTEEVQPGSYYNMIPTVVKEKSEESSEIDSSDDEKLRAKLLNLEKKLHKTKKRKHKKRNRQKSSKCRDRDEPIAVEVSSTTDIQDIVESSNSQNESIEVTSTQKNNQKESSEEGEITSDDESQESFEIDPTDLRHKLKRSRKPENTIEKSKVDVCGPALPPHLQKKHRGKSTHDIEGPILPPHLRKKGSSIGPSIPENMRKVLAETEHVVIRDDSSDEDVGIGPLPVGSEKKWSKAHQGLEERALSIKIKQLDGHGLSETNIKSREQWMLELPEGKAKYLGLEARSFRAKEGPDMSDRSSWTDTPEEKARKAAGIVKEEEVDVSLKKDVRARVIANRDEEQEQAVKKHKKKHKRDESLLDMHQKKLKKKKKKDEKEDDKKERRPFSRDLDLQVNRFDEAQKKSIIKKAQDLNTRFSRGEAKFL